MGFSVEALKLIQSYISEQQQYIQIDGETSSTQLNNFGVPQGSILSPVLFNYIYIVDIVDNISCNSIQYTAMIPHYTNIASKRTLELES